MADAMRKRDAKKVYFDRQRVKYFLPDADGSIPNSAPVKAAASQRVAEAVHEWADTFDLPPGEGGVLMSMLGSLGNIATATDSELSKLPIEDRTRHALHTFFGSKETMGPMMETFPLTEDSRPPVPSRILVRPSPVPIVQANRSGPWNGSQGGNNNGLRHGHRAQNLQLPRQVYHTTGQWRQDNHPRPIQPLYGNPPAASISPFSAATPAPPVFHRQHQSSYTRGKQPHNPPQAGPILGYRRYG